MARRSGGSHKGVEEKRRTIPIYQHYTLSPGKTKSHHPEAKCNHCLKEFVCGSKQRLIRHIRKCNSISNPDQIIAETLNTLARSSATGQLNQSILEASNLLPSQISHIHHSTTQQLVGQAIQLPSTTITTANSNIANNIGHHNNNDSNNLTSVVMVQSLNNNEHGIVASSSNGSASVPVKKPQKRGRKPGNQGSNGPGIHVTTGIDGKTHFTPASQLPPSIQGTSTPLMTQVHNGRGINGNYNNYQPTVATSASSVSAPSSGQLACVTSNHHHPTQFKLNTEPIDKAYLKLVITRNLPLSLCDTKEFQSWVKTLANDYKPPSSITLITQNLKYEAHLARQKVSNILVKASKKTINLELHSWPDELRGHSWYGMIAGIEQRRFLVSVRDAADQVSEDNNNAVSQDGNSPPSYRTLTTFIDDCIKRVGSDRINSLMFSGANNSQDVIITRARQNLYTNHPSIVTCYCWWHFTNLLCSDIVEFIEPVQSVVRDSNILMNFMNKRPLLNSYLEKFGPFTGASGSLNLKKEDSRWYSHLVCYLLDYIRNNKEGIHKALDAHSASSTRPQNDNNNNPSTPAGNNPLDTSSTTSTQRQNHQVTLYQEDAHMLRAKSIVTSTEFWTNLDLALVYLKPLRDIVALSTNHSSSISNSLSEFTHKHQTPTISSVVANNLSLGEYMNWFLQYGRTLLEQWRISPDGHKYQLIGSYLGRFSANLSDFNLLFAAYLLNPKYRCSYMTQRAKDKAIEEILNIASEFMPEESDGHTIFDQWKLYLSREEPYAVAFDETCQNPLDWWMSVPCAESIRRVALRILRLRTFTSPRPENLFSQLYFYEDETKTYLSRSCFDDVANLRFFYEYEDKVGQLNLHHSFQEQSINQSNNFSVPSNGFLDRTNIGQVHSNQLHQANSNTKSISNGSLGLSADTNGHLTDTSLLNDSTNKSSFTDSYSDIVESYINHSDGLGIVSQTTMSGDNMSNLTLESIPGYEQFSIYVDFNVLGVQVVEEPIEKKKRKWTAQEIISKCQSSSHNNNNNNNDVDNNKRIKSN